MNFLIGIHPEYYKLNSLPPEIFFKSIFVYNTKLAMTGPQPVHSLDNEIVGNVKSLAVQDGVLLADVEPNKQYEKYLEPLSRDKTDKCHFVVQGLCLIEGGKVIGFNIIGLLVALAKKEDEDGRK